MQESPGMNRVGRCWGRGKSRQRGELPPRQRARCKRWKFCPHPARIKKLLQSTSLPVCQLTAVTKAFVALGMCCFSGIEGAAQNDNWVLFHFFKKLTGYRTK